MSQSDPTQISRDVARSDPRSAWVPAVALACLVGSLVGAGAAQAQFEEVPATWGGSPHEDWNLFATRLDNAWMLTPVVRAIGQYQATLKKYPNIKPGEELSGYPKQ